MRIRLSSLLSAFSLLSPSVNARADHIAPCSPPDSPVKALPFLSEVPALVLDTFRARVGEIASPGETFDSTDVVVIGRNKRIIFVWNRDGRYLFATEQGGIAYNDPVFVYQVDPKTHTVKLISEEIAFPATVCNVAGSMAEDGKGSTRVRTAKRTEANKCARYFQKQTQTYWQERPCRSSTMKFSAASLATRRAALRRVASHFLNAWFGWRRSVRPVTGCRRSRGVLDASYLNRLG